MRKKLTSTYARMASTTIDELAMVVVTGVMVIGGKLIKAGMTIQQKCEDESSLN